MPAFDFVKDNLSNVIEENKEGMDLEKRYKEVNIQKYFNPYRLKEDSEPFQGGYQMIFMTTPDMNVLDNSGVIPTLSKSQPIFAEQFQMNPYIVQSLQYSNGGTDSQWIKFLSNRFKSIGTKDVTMKTTEKYETSRGWKQILPTGISETNTADNLSLTFTENKDLDVIKFHLLWLKYIEAVRYGEHPIADRNKMRRTLDFTSSVYYFILDADLSKILFYSKYTGVFPIAIPIGSLGTSINDRSIQDVSINYAYMYKEDLEPGIILDFNAVANHVSDLYNYNRSANGQNSYNSDMNKMMNTYGYGEFPDSENNYKKPIDFLNDRKFTDVEIYRMNNNDYDHRNRTGFKNSENLSKISYMMKFLNKEDPTSSAEGMAAMAANKYDKLKDTFWDIGSNNLSAGLNDIYNLSSNGFEI